MIGVFKKRDGWTLEKELPNDRPKEIYNFAIPSSISFDDIFSVDSRVQPNHFIIQFELIDFWQNRNGEYIKAFYEEI